ncbi:unnamed protein product [Rangifer tarandus platyrhynchus]|uniref:Uncharacterized protein n=1 Tax=Rangifer tarandus platyrhynchus TaxID=3082113 RepID=A0ABN9A295_RANTA|nr:unnamed protein product [Rangifer tarandus platyrhynchus]
MTHPGGNLDPGGIQGRQASIMQEEHALPPPTLTLHWELSCASDVKVAFLNNHCLPRVGVVPKGKYQLAETRDGSAPAHFRTRKREKVQASRDLSLPARQASTAPATPL